VSKPKWFGRASIVVGVLVIAIAAVAGASAGGKATNPYNLKKPGTLTVGMTLQFKPQMYLDAKGKPAGYDVVLLKALAKQWRVKLDIKNLDSTGSSRASSRRGSTWSRSGCRRRRSERSRSASAAHMSRTRRSSRPPMMTPRRRPWRELVRQDDHRFRLDGGQLVQKTFANATSRSFPDQNAAFLEVSTGRADGIVVENYLLAQFNKSNGNALKVVPFAKPLHVEYGSYGVQKGNGKLAAGLSQFICKMQKSGQLAKVYQSTIAHRCRRCRAAGSLTPWPRRSRWPRSARLSVSPSPMSSSSYDILVIGGGPAVSQRP
jgi:ABC-type amino acid transport substrate-binding protein